MSCPDQLCKMLQGPSTPLSAGVHQQPKGSRLTCQAVEDSLEPGEAGRYRTPGEACLQGGGSVRGSVRCSLATVPLGGSREGEA